MTLLYQFYNNLNSAGCLSTAISDRPPERTIDLWQPASFARASGINNGFGRCFIVSASGRGVAGRLYRDQVCLRRHTSFIRYFAARTLSVANVILGLNRCVMYRIRRLFSSPPHLSRQAVSPQMNSGVRAKMAFQLRRTSLAAPSETAAFDQSDNSVSVHGLILIWADPA